MKKKGMLLCVAVVLLWVMASMALAETWVCPSCSQDNAGNFCSNCGQKRPDDSSGGTLSNLRVTVQDNSDVLLRWEDSANSPPYTVTYAHSSWSHYLYDEVEYQGTNATLSYLIPGVTYVLTVSNGVDELVMDYTMPRRIYTEFATGGKYMSLTKTKFSLSDLEENPTESFQVRISWPQLKYDREYAGKLALNTPYGYASLVYHWDTFTLENRYDYIYMNYAISEWLDWVEIDYGSIPTGEYTFELFLDGQLYDYASFTVAK